MYNQTMEGTFELDHPPLEVISVIKGHIKEEFLTFFNIQ